MTKCFVPAVLAAVLAGCSLAPTYQRPAAPVAGHYPAVPAGGAAPAASSARPAADIAWRAFFTDARLRKLIELALANNRDLRIAALNVEKARAQYQIQGAALLPTVNANGADSHQRLSASQSLTGHPMTTRADSLSVGITSYELDFFGKVRNARDSAVQQYLATAEARTSAQISLVSQVAGAYLSLLALDEQSKLTGDTLKANQDSLRLTQRSFELGNATALDVRSAETQVESARASLAALKRQRAQAENALVLLVGQPLPAGLPAARPLGGQRLVSDLPAGLPSDLLARRPDIRAAEDQLKAADANIGVARAAFFPSITLTGGVGTASGQLSGLFGGGSGTWSFIPQVNLPIFNGGRNQANLDAARADQKIAVAQYEKAIQTAFREVADALAARTTLDEQIDAQERLVKAERQRHMLAEARYRNGVDSYLVFLDAQRSLYAAQLNLIQAQQSRLDNLVTLYKVLGGGWK